MRDVHPHARGYGRTTHMLREALRRANAGEQVFVIMDDPRHATNVLVELDPKWRQSGNLCISSRAAADTSLLGRSKTTVFVDHYVDEIEREELRRNLHRERARANDAIAKLETLRSILR